MVIQRSELIIVMLAQLCGQSNNSHAMHLKWLKCISYYISIKLYKSRLLWNKSTLGDLVTGNHCTPKFPTGVSSLEGMWLMVDGEGLIGWRYMLVCLKRNWPEVL